MTVKVLVTLVLIVMVGAQLNDSENVRGEMIEEGKMAPGEA